MSSIPPHTQVEIIGDAYFVVGGCPLALTDHVERTTRAALRYKEMVPALELGDDVQIRIGLHTGPVIAGVVGLQDPRYHLFGDTVSYAENMESHGVPSRVHVSEATAQILMASSQTSQFKVTLRGPTEVKGFGTKNTYFVDRGQTKFPSAIVKDVLKASPSTTAIRSVKRRESAGFGSDQIQDT